MNKIDKDLLDILVCPVTKDKLLLDEENNELQDLLNNETKRISLVNLDDEDNDSSDEEDSSDSEDDSEDSNEDSNESVSNNILGSLILEDIALPG